MLRLDLDEETKRCKRTIESCYDEFRLGTISPEPAQTKITTTESDKGP